MKRVVGIWHRFTGGERLLAGFVLLVVAASCVLAAVALVKRPGDISNPDAAFTGGAKLTQESKPDDDDRSTDWPRYGYDTERTKFLNAQKVRPPFRKLWKYDQDELIEFAPIIAGERMYMIDNDARFIALNNDTGKVIWKKHLGKLNASSPVFWRGTLLAVNLVPGQALAVRARDGKLLWRKELPSRAESSPVVVGGTMYFGTEAGTFFALDARNGKVEWQQQLGGAIKAAPAFTDGTLYVGDYGGKFSALRASDGAIRWQTSDLGVGLGRSGRFYSTAAVAFGRVYVGNVDGRVYSFDRQTGEIAWTFSAGDFVYSGIAAADGPKTKPAVYFGSHDRTAYSLDAKSGSVNWKASPGGQVSGPATVVGDVVYMSTFSGNATVGFDLGTGRRVFKFDEGEYGPVVSDGKRLFVVGGSSVLALKPVKIGKFKAAPGTKGIVPPSERRRIRKRSKQRAAEQGSSGESASPAQGEGSGEKAEQQGGGRNEASGPKPSGKRKGSGKRKRGATKKRSKKKKGSGEKKGGKKQGSGKNNGSKNKGAGKKRGKAGKRKGSGKKKG